MATKSLLEPKTQRKIELALDSANVIYFNLKSKDKEVITALSRLEDIIFEYEDALLRKNKTKRMYDNLLLKYKKIKEGK